MQKVEVTEVNVQPELHQEFASDQTGIVSIRSWREGNATVTETVTISVSQTEEEELERGFAPLNYMRSFFS